MGMLLISCDNDDYIHAQIPSVVLNEFWSHFPEASDVEFTKTGIDYEVDFKWKGNDAGVVIAPDGVGIKEKIEISYEELPAGVQHALGKYGKNKIGDVDIVKINDDNFYQVEVKQFWFDKRIVLDNSGKEDKTITYWD